VTQEWLLDPCKRLERYLDCFRISLKSLKVLSRDFDKVVDLALRYFKDAQYYLEKGDCITGLVAIAYAEGLLDAARVCGGIELEWQRSWSETRVVVAGSFDILHPGHVEFLRWASSLGDKLFVIVSRDVNYRRFKGIDPVFREDERLKLVSAIRYVYRAVLGDSEDMLRPITEIRPSIIALGPDQRLDEEYLIKELRERGLDVKVIRLERRVPGYSSSLIKKRIAELYSNSRD